MHRSRLSLSSASVSFALGVAVLGAGCARADDASDLQFGAGDASAAGDADAGASDAPSDRSAATDARDARADSASDATPDGEVEASLDAAGDVGIDVGVDAAPPCGGCATDETCTIGGCVTGRLVFVAAEQTGANLGGVAAADRRCQSIARSSGRQGTYMAWLSDSTTSPSTRFTRAATPYVLADGTVIANDWNDLTSGSIRHAIDRDVYGHQVVNAEVWTHTRTDGTSAGSGCSDFTSSANGDPYAYQGLTSRSDYGWSEVYLQYCDRTNVRTFCFEQ